MSKTGDQDNITIVISDLVAVVETQVSGVIRIDNTAVAYTESMLRGRAAHAVLDPEGITHGFNGQPSQGEEGTLKACGILIDVLNRAAGTWGSPTTSSNEADDADAVSNRLDGREGELRMQVIRARDDQSFWAKAHRDNGHKVSASPNELAEELRAPIERKVRKIPPAQRSKLVLVLNAMDTAGYALGDVADVFRANHGEWAKAWGFQEIWLVGPNAHLTHQLA